MATKDFVPKPEGKSFKTAWIHKSTFFKEIPFVRPNVPSNQQKALCEPGTKYPTQIPKPRECRLYNKRSYLINNSGKLNDSWRKKFLPPVEMTASFVIPNECEKSRFMLRISLCPFFIEQIRNTVSTKNMGTPKSSFHGHCTWVRLVRKWGK